MQTSVRAAAGARTGAHVGGWQRSSPAAPAPNRHPQRTRPRVASGGGGVASRPVVGGGGARRQARAWGEEGGEPRRPCRPARRRRARTPDGGRAKPPAAATNGGGVGGVARRGAACRALRACTPPPTGPLWRGGASLSRGGGRKPRLGRPDGTDGGDPMGVQSSREASGAHRGGSTAPRPLPCGPWGARCFKQRSVFQTAGARHGSAQRRRRGGDASASISSPTPPPPPLSARAAARTSTARVGMRGASSGSSGVYKGKASTVPRTGAVAPSSPADAAAVDGGGTLSGAGGSAVPHPSPPCALYLSHLCPAAAAALFVTLCRLSLPAVVDGSMGLQVRREQTWPAGEGLPTDALVGAEAAGTATIAARSVTPGHFSGQPTRSHSHHPSVVDQRPLVGGGPRVNAHVQHGGPRVHAVTSKADRVPTRALPIVEVHQRPRSVPCPPGPAPTGVNPSHRPPPAK